MTNDVNKLVQEKYPGVQLDSDVQGWAFLEEFDKGVDAYSKKTDPTPADDRWVGVCLFQLVRDLEALEALYRALNRGEIAARVNIAHVLRFVERADDASEELSRVRPDQFPSSYDQVLYFRVLSIHEENNGNLREALRAAEEAWRRIQGIPEFGLLAPSILAQLATLHGRIGRSQRALWFLERGLQVTSGAELLKLHLRRAYVLISLGRYQEAQSELEALDLSHAPDIFQPERHWLLGEVARSRGNLLTAIHEYEQVIELAVRLQMGYEEFLGRIPLMAILGHRGDFSAASEHAARAQTLISDKSDRLEFRFREVLLLHWQGVYTSDHAIAELEALIEELGAMGLLKEQGHVQLHKAEALRVAGGNFESELDKLQALSVTLQNPAFLAPEWSLLPELQVSARRTHPRIAGQTQSALRVTTLGQEHIVLDMKPISIPLRKGVEVLAYFLENKAVTLKQLLAEVFPDDKPRSAKSYFHQFRHQLRENVEGLEIEYDGESKMYRLKSEIDIVWDVSELRAGRIMGKTGLFLPSSGNDWALAVDRSLDPYREAVGALEVI